MRAESCVYSPKFHHTLALQAVGAVSILRSLILTLLLTIVYSADIQTVVVGD
jgi:hypothetical protein